MEWKKSCGQPYTLNNKSFSSNQVLVNFTLPENQEIMVPPQMQNQAQFLIMSYNRNHKIKH